MTTEQTAQDAFVAQLAEADALLARLHQHVDGRFGIQPEQAHRGHVGQVEFLLGLLRVHVEHADRITNLFIVDAAERAKEAE